METIHEVVLLTLDFCEKYWKAPADAIFRQLQHSALSVQLNIAEGYALKSPRLVCRHLNVAYGSAVETSD